MCYVFFTSFYISTLFLVETLLLQEEKTPAAHIIIKHSSKIWSIQCVVLPKLFFSQSVTHSHTPQLCQTLWASPQVLGYSVKQLEWAQKSECCLCSWFPFHFEVSPRLTGTGATKPDSCEGFRPLCQDCGVAGEGSSNVGQRYVLSQCGFVVRNSHFLSVQKHWRKD